MELTQITRDNLHAIPMHLQRGAKVGLVVGAKIFVSNDYETLLAQFEDNDRYHFDPDNATLHCLEALGIARSRGFVVHSHPAGVWTRSSLAIRIVFSNLDVRVQIGSSRWYNRQFDDTAKSMRAALVDAFCDYYNAAVAPYPKA